MDNNNLNQYKDDKPSVPQPGQQFEPYKSDATNHPKKPKRKLVIALILFLVLLGGGIGIAYFLFIKQNEKAPSLQTSSQDKPKLAGPAALSYIPLSPNNTQTINTLNLSDNSKSVALTDYGAVMESDVVANSIAFVTAPKPGSTPPAVFYSSDNGMSFSKVYETKQSSNAGDPGEQITSMKLSSDGSAIVIGLLSEANRKNTVIDIDPSSKTTEQLFTSDQQGVYIHAYQNGKQLVYTKGCYECGSVNPTTIFSYDLNAKKEISLITTQLVFDLKNIKVNSDFSSLVFTERPFEQEVPDNAPSSPYTIKQFDLSDSSSKSLASVDLKDGQVSNFAVNFLAQSNVPYYIAGKKVTSLGSNEPITLFESTREDVYEVYYADQDVIYFSLGQGKPTTSWVYKNSDKSLTQLLKDIEVLRVLGVTSNN